MGEKVQRYENRQNELKRQMEDLVNNNEKLYKEQDKLFWEMLTTDELYACIVLFAISFYFWSRIVIKEFFG